MASQTMKGVLRWSIVALSALGVLAMVGPLVTYKSAEIRICSISGSTWTTVTWFGLFRTEQRTTTALETWLQARDPSFQPRWRHLSTNGWQVLGRSFACSRAPAIYQLLPILDLVVQKLSTERLTALIRVLQEGSLEDQDSFIQSVTDELL